MSVPLLAVRDLGVRFGGIIALNKVSFDVTAGSITALIGPNGAGKTSLFNCITGFYRPTAGSILLEFQGRNIDLASKRFHGFFGGTHLVNQAGVARTFQNIRLFPEMTALENLLVAQHHRAIRNPLAGLLQTPSFRRREAELVSTAYQWLDIVGIGASANSLAAELPYGHQRRLEIARAMCTGPRLICLDEPAAGLNPTETEDLAVLIKLLNREHQVTVFVIEHDMALVMDISDHVVVLNYGEVIASDTPTAVRQNPVVMAAYLGDANDTEGYS